jgi:serine/threonine protein kinase
MPEAPDSESHGTSLRSGRVIFSRYRLDHPLGHGGMGVVWLAHDRNLDRPVALKFLAEAIYSNPEARDALKRETRRGVELTHPNIVRVHDFVEDGETGAIALEYLDGATLTELRLEHRQGCLEVGGLGSWVAELCRALDYAHQSAQMAHGDLKPANLLISSGGVLKVADFGVGCALRRATSNLSCDSGSLRYMSPQQHRGDAPATSDDIYSIGAILYEALTSSPPISSPDIALEIQATIPDQMAIRRQKLGVAGEPIPRHWEETILACLEKEPQNRPSSAAEIARRLEIEFFAAAHLEAPCSESKLTLTTTEAVAKRHHWREGRKAAAIRCVKTSTELLASAFSSAAAHWSRTKEQVAPILADLLAVKVEPAWKWLKQRKSLAPGAMVVAAGVVVVTAYWPRDQEPKEWHPTRKGKEPAIPAYAITVPGKAPLSPPDAVELGGIMIRTEPSGASISIDGVAAGLTPTSVNGLKPGEHGVAIQLVGFDRVSIPATVRASRFTDLGTIALQRSSGTLQVTTDPAGAQIILAGRDLGRTPLTAKLSSGAYRGIGVHLDGYVDTTFDATVAAEETLALPTMMLRPEPPRLAVTTQPGGIPFQVFPESGRTPGTPALFSGVTPATINDIRAGVYRVVFRGASPASESIAVTVGERGTTPLHRDLPHGTLKVESTPGGAEIFEGERCLGRTPLKVALLEGSHVIIANLNDRTARPRAVKIAPQEVESLRFDFTTSSPPPRSHRVRASRRRKRRARSRRSATRSKTSSTKHGYVASAFKCRITSARGSSSRNPPARSARHPQA